MSDIFDFRMLRAPQRALPTLTLELYPPRPVTIDAGDMRLAMLRAPTGSHAAADDATGRFGAGSVMAELMAAGSCLPAAEVAHSHVTSSGFLGGGVPLGLPLRELDVWLSARGNRVAPAEIDKFLVNQLAAIVANPIGPALRLALANRLIVAMVGKVDPAIRGELARLLLIAGLLEDLVALPSKVVTKDDVYDRLRWRTLVIPKELLPLLRSSARLARRYGFSDYYVVREEWSAYRAGEIAHIENALAGEFRERTHTRMSETETAAINEENVAKSEERETQTTDRLQLSEHAKRDVSLAVHVEGKVDASGQFGPVKVETHLGGSFDYSSNESRERATDQAHETVARAVAKAEERTRVVRSQRRLERFEEKNLHRIENTAQGAKPVTAIYRWVDKIQRLQLFSFPHRMLLEFLVPEPASFVRWRRARQTVNFANPAPPTLAALDKDGVMLVDSAGNFKPLAPTDLSELNYIHHVARFGVASIEPPPADKLSFATTVDLTVTTDATATIAHSGEDKTFIDLVSAGGAGGDSGVMIPEGYHLGGWSVLMHSYGTSWGVGSPATLVPAPAPAFYATVGQDIVASSIWNDGKLMPVARFSPPAGVDRRGISGRVPVTIVAHWTREMKAHLQLDCILLREHFLRWQLRCFELISAAHATMKQRHEEEKAGRAVGKGIAIEGDSPTRNAEVVREEIKRAVVRLVSDGRYPPVPAATGQLVSTTTGPVLDLEHAEKSAPEVQFIEQAFEWENLSYVLYPYYWAAEKSWRDLADISGADPEFDRFLRSGSARVVVPARPGFEDQVRMYVDLGVLWGGGPVPAVGEPEYLAIAEEIKHQRQPLRTGIPGDWWEVKLPTTLVALDQDSALPKENPKPELGPPPKPVAPPTP